MYELLIMVLDKLELKYAIRSKNGEQFISLTFEKEDMDEVVVRYNVLIFAEEILNAVTILIPSISPLGVENIDLIDIITLEDKINYLNEKSLYGKLTVESNKEITYDYSFVYINDFEYLEVVVKSIFEYIDFIVYETALLTSPLITLKEFRLIREKV